MQKKFFVYKSPTYFDEIEIGFGEVRKVRDGFWYSEEKQTTVTVFDEKDDAVKHYCEIYKSKVAKLDHLAESLSVAYFDGLENMEKYD